MSNPLPAQDHAQGYGVIPLRDHFATIALREIIAHRLNETVEKKAIEEYQIADSMMRQRERAATGLPGRITSSLKSRSGGYHETF